MNPITGQIRGDCARQVFDYLAARDALPVQTCDAVLGFGVFDLKLPRFCGELYVSGHARRIIFTGGVGAGSADLGMPEADAWSAALLQAYPQIPRDHIILENRSTNTGENVSFTTELLAQKHPHLLFGRGIQSVIAVAAPARLRRVRLTLQRVHPTLRVSGQHHGPSYEAEHALYAGKGLDLIAQLVGELDRIVDYAARGWILPEAFPPSIVAAHQVLKRASAPQRPLVMAGRPAPLRTAPNREP
jgi:hypothetical protein